MAILVTRTLPCGSNVASGLFWLHSCLLSCIIIEGGSHTASAIHYLNLQAPPHTISLSSTMHSPPPLCYPRLKKPPHRSQTPPAPPRLSPVPPAASQPAGSFSTPQVSPVPMEHASPSSAHPRSYLFPPHTTIFPPYRFSPSQSLATSPRSGPALPHLLLQSSTPNPPPFSKEPRNKKTETHLNHLPPNPLPTLPHPHSHIRQQRRVPDVGGVAVAVDVARPFVLGRVGVPGPDVPGLELL